MALTPQKISLEDNSFIVGELKRFMRQNKETLEEIIIKRCKSDLRRFEAVSRLFLESDLLLIDFHNLRLLEVEDLMIHEEEKECFDHMNTLYQQSLSDLKSKLKTHLTLRKSLNSSQGTLVIKQLAFDYKHAFQYALHALRKYQSDLKCISFVNILDMKTNAMKDFCEKIRELKHLQELQFINVLFNDQNILQIRYLLNWRQQHIQKLVFKRAQLSHYQLLSLFCTPNFQIRSLIALTNVVFTCDKKLESTSVFKVLKKEFDSIILQNISHQKLSFQASSHKNKVEQLKRIAKQKLMEPKKIILYDSLKISKYSAFPKELQQPLKTLLFKLSQSNFCSELNISAFALIGAPQDILNDLIKAVCLSFSLHTLKLQNSTELLQMLLGELRNQNNSPTSVAESSIQIIEKQNARLKIINSQREIDSGLIKSISEEKYMKRLSKHIEQEEEQDVSQLNSISRLHFHSSNADKLLSYQEMKFQVRRKTLQLLQIEGSEYNTFGQSSLKSIIELAQFSEKIVLDFKNSILSKDGMVGLIDGFDILKKRKLGEETIELKDLLLKNVNSSSLLNIQLWRKLGERIVECEIESLEILNLKGKSTNISSMINGIMYKKRGEYCGKLKLKKLVLFQKTEKRRDLRFKLNSILSSLPLRELRISCKVDKNLYQQENAKRKSQNDSSFKNNNMSGSHQYKQYTYSNGKEDEILQTKDFSLIPSDDLKILQISSFNNYYWPSLISSISNSYSFLQELDFSENQLSLGFLTSFHPLTKLTMLKTLVLKNNPLRSSSFFENFQKQQQLQLQQQIQNGSTSLYTNLMKKTTFNQINFAKQNTNAKDLQSISPPKQGFKNEKRGSFLRKSKSYNVKDDNLFAKHPTKFDTFKEFSPNAKAVPSIVFDKGIHKCSTVEIGNSQEGDQNAFGNSQKENQQKSNIEGNKMLKQGEDKGIHKLRMRLEELKQFQENQCEEQFIQKIMRDFISDIFSMKELREVDLSNTGMTNTEVELIDDAIINPKYDESHLNFSTINLSGNSEISLNDIFKKKFTQCIPQLDGSIRMGFSSSKQILQLQASKILAQQTDQKIAELNLSNFDLNTELIKKILSILSLNNNQFKLIDLSDNVNIPLEMWSQIFTLLFTHQGIYLEQLSVAGCHLEDKHIFEICNALDSICKTQGEEIEQKYQYGSLALNFIDFSRNGTIEKDGWYRLISTLFGQSMICLRSIYLKNCNINNIKTQYLLEGLKAANKKLRESSDICLRCLEEIDLDGNPIPLTLQIIIQQNFLLSNILQEQMSQVQEYKEQTIKTLEEMDEKRQDYINSIIKYPIDDIIPSAQIITIGIECSQYLDIMLPEILQQFSFIQKLVIYFTPTSVDKLMNAISILTESQISVESPQDFELASFAPAADEIMNKSKRIKLCKFHHLILICEKQVIKEDFQNTKQHTREEVTPDNSKLGSKKSNSDKINNQEQLIIASLGKQVGDEVSSQMVDSLKMNSLELSESFDESIMSNQKIEQNGDINQKQNQSEFECEEYEFFEQNQEQYISYSNWSIILERLLQIGEFKSLKMVGCQVDALVLNQINELNGLQSINFSHHKHLYLLPKSKISNSQNKKISGSRFDGFQKLFSQNSIQELNISYTQIDERVAIKIGEGLENSRIKEGQIINLKYLDLSGNKQFTSKSFQSLIRSIIDNSKVETLILKDCNISNSNVQGLINGFLYSNFPYYLQKVVLAGNVGIYPKEWGKLIATLFQKFEIKEIDISSCAIYDAKLEAIVENMHENRMNLIEMFGFNDNVIKSPTLMFKLLDILLRSPKIKTIQMRNCNINQRNSEFFSHQLHLLRVSSTLELNSLRIFDLSKNPFIQESYSHSKSFLQALLENMSKLFTNIIEINLSKCFIDTPKINSFIQLIQTIANKGYKIKSLKALNLSQNRFQGHQFQNLIPNISQIFPSLQNLNIGHCYPLLHKYQQQSSDYIQDLDQSYLMKLLKNPLQGIKQGLIESPGLKLVKFSISDYIECQEEDWKQFLNCLFDMNFNSLEHLRIEGKQKMGIQESRFFGGLRSVLTQKKHIIETNEKKMQRGGKILMKIKSISYSENQQNSQIFVLPSYNWTSFIKKGFQSEMESGHILAMSLKEYQEIFWYAPTYQQSIFVKLHDDINSMKFEDAYFGDSFSQNLKLRADLYISMNQLRKFINCQNIDQQYQQDELEYSNEDEQLQLHSQKSNNSNTNIEISEIQDKSESHFLVYKQKRKRLLYLNFNYSYPKLPIFIIPGILREPLNLKDADLTPVLNGFEKLAFEYPLYIFLIQTCNLYPCDSIVHFFVEFIKSLVSYTFAPDVSIFSIVQASPSFFLTEKDRDKIQSAINKLNTLKKEDKQIEIKAFPAHSTAKNLGVSFQPEKTQQLQTAIKINSSVSPSNFLLQNSINSQRSPQYSPQASIINPNKVLFYAKQPQKNPTSGLEVLENTFPQSYNKTNSQVNKSSSLKKVASLFKAEMIAQPIDKSFVSFTSQKGLINNEKPNQQLSKKQIQKQMSHRMQANKSWKILCPYYFSSNNMNEREEYQIIKRIQKMPPSDLELKGLSISAIKTIYAFCFTNPYFTSCQMDYKLSVFVNASLAWSLRESIYRNFFNGNHSYIKNKLLLFTFNSLKLAIRDDIFYKYDNSAIMLDEYFQHSQKTFIFLLFLIIPYHLAVSIAPFIFSNSEGITIMSHLVYALFSLFLFITELLLVKNTLKRVLHLTPGIYVQEKKSIWQIIKLFIVNQSVVNYKFLIYFLYIIYSQLSLFNQYSNWCFLFLTFQNEDNTIFFMSAFILLSDKLLAMYRLISLIQQQILKPPKGRQLPGFNITLFYQASIQLDFVAFSDVLNVVSPYNVTKIPNNYLTRVIFSRIYGQSINQRIYYQLIRIAFKDLPQIILQISFLAGKVDWVAYLSLIMSFISFSFTFYKILSIRPSIISQLDFDELKVQKQADHLQVQNQFDQDQKQMFEEIIINSFRLPNNNIKSNQNNH